MRVSGSLEGRRGAERGPKAHDLRPACRRNAIPALSVPTLSDIGTGVDPARTIERVMPSGTPRIRPDTG
jgi:hypothetical protein